MTYHEAFETASRNAKRTNITHRIIMCEDDMISCCVLLPRELIPQNYFVYAVINKRGELQ
jgi:hypothetical protein